jgi:hypothetical protein
MGANQPMKHTVPPEIPNPNFHMGATELKYRWKVAPPPTGRYRSFDKRSWPRAFYNNQRESIAGAIYSEDAYDPRNVKEGKHAPLIVRIADHSVTPWKWWQLKGTFPTLDAAKQAFASVLAKNPQLQPKPEPAATPDQAKSIDP